MTMKQVKKEGYDENFQDLQKHIKNRDIRSFQESFPAFQNNNLDGNPNHIYNTFLLLQDAVGQNKQAFVNPIIEYIPQLKSDQTLSHADLKDFIDLYAEIIRKLKTPLTIKIS